MAPRVTEAEIIEAIRPMVPDPRVPRRAVAFGGGGPAVGISVGFLLALEEWNESCRRSGDTHHVIEFPVWVAGCVGAWLTCLYHIADTTKGRQLSKAHRTREWIRKFFRDHEEYANFPAPTTFTPDIPEMIKAATAYLVRPESYQSLVVPAQIQRAYADLLNFYLTPSRWNHGDFCHLMLNSVFAPNPATRLMMGMLYKTEVPGLNRLWFDKDYSLLKNIGAGIAQLAGPEYPDIYINAYNLKQHDAQIFCNHAERTKAPDKQLTIEALCASSALPFILSPVEVNHEPYIEGALVDSFCFEAVHSLDDEIDEIWISQIVDHQQIKPPTNLLEALNNLIMMYAGTTSRRDVESYVNDLNLREYMAHLLLGEEHPPRPVECLRLPVQADTTYFWTHQNFDNSVEKSKRACLDFIAQYSRGVDRAGRRQADVKNFFMARM